MRGDAFEMMNISNFKQRVIGNSKYIIEPLNCCHVRHNNIENLVFEVNQVMPVHKYTDNFTFVNGCLYILPKCFPIVDYALLYNGNLILIQVSVLSLSEHQEKKKEKTKDLSFLTNPELEGIFEKFKIQKPKKSKDNYIKKILNCKDQKGNVNGKETTVKDFIKETQQIDLDLEQKIELTQHIFWDLLWNESKTGEKLWKNAFGTSSEVDKKRVFLLYVTSSDKIPRERKIDENNPNVLIVPGKKLDSILLNDYLKIINNISLNNKWEFTKEELKICNLYFINH